MSLISDKENVWFSTSPEPNVSKFIYAKSQTFQVEDEILSELNIFWRNGILPALLTNTQMFSHKTTTIYKPVQQGCGVGGEISDSGLSKISDSDPTLPKVPTP